MDRDTRSVDVRAFLDQYTTRVLRTQERLQFVYGLLAYASSVYTVRKVYVMVVALQRKRRTTAR